MSTDRAYDYFEDNKQGMFMQPLAVIDPKDNTMGVVGGKPETGIENPVAQRAAASPEIIGSAINAGDSLASMQITLPPKINAHESGLGLASRHLSNTIGEAASELFSLFGSKGNNADPTEELQAGMGLRTFASNNMQHNFRPPTFGL